MKDCYKRLHVLSPIMLNSMLLIITFCTNNPIILACILFTCIFIFYNSANLIKLKSGIIIFIPFAILTIIINVLFVQQGTIILFHLGNRRFTLEALVYAIILASKLLIVIYIFDCLGIMLDSDKAVSYFSSMLPKSTLTFMIALKLFPTMRKRILSLKEIYSIRGVNFQGKSIKEKVKSYVPILSILLEDSLEKSFDIGEAAYVRGFLSSKRSVYDKRHLQKNDLMIILISLAIILDYVILQLLGLENYDIYGLNAFLFNKGVAILVILFIFLNIVLIFLQKRLVIKDELYRN